MPVRRTLRVVRRYWRVGMRRARVVTAPARRAWRRSLQMRVVAITLVASSLLVGAFGWFVAYRGAGILLNRAQDEVISQGRNKADYATRQLSVHRSAVDPKLPITINETVNLLADSDPAVNGGAIVTIRAALYPKIKPVTSANVDTAQLITETMVAQVGRTGFDAIQIRTTDINGVQTKYLVYGSPVGTNFGHVELYYLVPLTTEDRAAN